ncbi:MAG: CHAT domain-containing protein [Egibacteraceae bacterium]
MGNPVPAPLLRVRGRGGGRQSRRGRQPRAHRGGRDARLGHGVPGRGCHRVAATLWPVEDYATALLMSRFYELVTVGSFQDGRAVEPVTAMRKAQQWLPTLTWEEEEHYRRGRPILRAHHASRRPAALVDDSPEDRRQITPLPNATSGRLFVVIGA